MPKPARIISVYDQGSNYLLLDTDDITPLYHVHFNTHSLPHMVVSRSGEPDAVTGSATFYPSKKGGFFSSASTIKVAIHNKNYDFNKEGGLFSTDKRTLYSSSHGRLFWKGGYAASGFLKLIDERGNIIADYQNRQYSGKKMGIIEIMNLVDVDDEFLDEIVVSGLTMLSEQKTSMGATAANLSSAGGGM